MFINRFCCGFILTWYFTFTDLQYATGMAAASQTIIVRTALSYQDVYEVKYLNASHMIFHEQLQLFRSSFNWSKTGLSEISPSLETCRPWGGEVTVHDAPQRNHQSQQDSTVQYSRGSKQLVLIFLFLYIKFGFITRPAVQILLLDFFFLKSVISPYLQGDTAACPTVFQTVAHFN